MYDQLAKSLEPNPIEQIFERNPKIFEAFLKPNNKNELQIILTQINRDRKNKAYFRTFDYQLDDKNYFYPGESVKLPLAIFALEKLNRFDLGYLDKYTPMKIGETEELGTKEISLSDCIENCFLFNDDDAFNKLYDFIDRTEINKKLKYYDLRHSKIVHRLGVDESMDAARKNPEVHFFKDGKLVFKKGRSIDKFNYPIKFNDNLIDVSNQNAFQLSDQNNLIKKLIFPESYPSTKQLNLKPDDYDFLYTQLSGSNIPKEKIPNDYFINQGKFLFYGADQKEYNYPNIKIFNTSGKAKDYITDNAYFIDFEHKAEFILSVSLKQDGIENEKECLSFLKNLGKKVYELEKHREKTYIPKFNNMVKYR
ncbi:serine hydrolase [Pedobacter segetis]|nr:serine hydrolase [Pedobacter segetis]